MKTNNIYAQFPFKTGDNAPLAEADHNFIYFVVFFAKMVNRTDVCLFMKEKNCPENY